MGVKDKNEKFDKVEVLRSLQNANKLAFVISSNLTDLEEELHKIRKEVEKLDSKENTA